MTKQQHIDLFISMAAKSEEEINAMCDTGMFNDIIKGYCILVIEQVGWSGMDIDFRSIFDEFTAYEARHKCKQL